MSGPKRDARQRPSENGSGTSRGEREQRDAIDVVAAFLAGALPEEERTGVEEALRDDPALRAAYDELAPAVAALAEAISLPDPAPDDPDRGERMAADGPQSAEALGFGAILEAIRRPERRVASAPPTQRWRTWASDSVAQGLFTLRAGDGAWEPTGVEGVEVRRLFVDRANNRMTAMFRMAPGSSYPNHVHEGFEECFVLDGDLHVGDALIMRAGDFQRAVAGSHHDRQWTEGGCLLLVSTSLDDEFVDGPDDGHDTDHAHGHG